MANCGSCKSELNDGASRCHECGYSEWHPKYKKDSQKFTFYLFLTLITLGLALPLTIFPMSWYMGKIIVRGTKRDPTIPEA